MMNSPLMPIIIPFAFAILLMFAPKQLRFQRAGALVGAILTVAASIWLLQKVHIDGIQVVTFGSWPVPYGITMVSDMVSILFVLTSSIITLFTIWYSFRTIGIAREQFFYYPGVLLMLVGVNGAFTTGDIFNLFVFFEVLLMASYLLSVLGGEKIQFRESIKYILVNVVSSALFVITVAMLYSVVGTLNMADIAQKVSDVNQPGILTAIAILFLVVFGLKAAIFPLFFWLPSSYSGPPIPVLALFGALLTKVGVYAITRTFTLFFTGDVAFTHTVLLYLSVATIVAGCIGALAVWDVKKIIIYNIIIAVGVILYGVATYNNTGLRGSMFYVVHDMLIKAALFFLVGIIVYITGQTNLKKMGGLMKRYPSLGWLYLIAAFSLAGIPPLSGFIGKMLLVKGGFEAEQFASGIWILLSSLIVLLSVIRIFVYAFWGKEQQLSPIKKTVYWQIWIPTAILVLLTVAYGVGADALMPYMTQAAEVLANPQLYIDAVKGGK